MSGNDLLLLLERPKEPVFIAKGEQKAVFEVPDKFVVNIRFFYSKYLLYFNER